MAVACSQPLCVNSRMLPPLPFSHNSTIGDLQHTAIAKSHTLLCIGSVDVVAAGGFQGFCRGVVQAAATAEHRLKQQGKKGFQRTPAFIHATIVYIVAALEGRASNADGEGAPRGGLTDVGVHTGGLPRDTCWPLVRETLLVGGLARATCQWLPH